MTTNTYPLPEQTIVIDLTSQQVTVESGDPPAVEVEVPSGVSAAMALLPLLQQLRTEVEGLVAEGETAVDEAEAARDLAQAARSGAELAETAAETAQGLAETAKTDAETAQAGSEAAQALAEAARDAAQLSETAAGTAQALAEAAKDDAVAEAAAAAASATASANSATASAGSATAAASSASAAAASASAAEDSADEAASIKSDVEAIKGTVSGYRADALQARNDAQTAETNAATSASDAEGSATTAEGHADDAEASATAAAASESASAQNLSDAVDAKDAAEAAETGAGGILANVQSIESDVESDASAAAASATSAGASATAASNSADAAEGFKDSAEAAEAAAVSAKDTTLSTKDAIDATASQVATDAQAASASETAAAGYASTAQTLKNDTVQLKSDVVDLRDETEVFRDQAVNAATALTGAYYPAGPFDSSGGVAPTAPGSEDPSPMYKITVGGTIGGVDYQPGDAIVWDGDSDWFKLDNTEKFVSINGQTSGTVTITPASIGALGENEKAADADLLDGQNSSYFTNIPARLGYSPVQQGTGVGQLGNTVKIGHGGSGKIKVTVDSNDFGNLARETWVTSQIDALADVAASGSYNDLVDVPNLGSAAQYDLATTPEAVNGTSGKILDAEKGHDMFSHLLGVEKVNSNTDTSGRDKVVTQGWMGNGELIALTSSDDVFNLPVDPGNHAWFRITYSDLPANLPPDWSGNGILHAHYRITTASSLELLNFPSTKKYFTSQAGGVWEDWVKVINTADLATSQDIIDNETAKVLTVGTGSELIEQERPAELQKFKGQWWDKAGAYKAGDIFEHGGGENKLLRNNEYNDPVWNKTGSLIDVTSGVADPFGGVGGTNLDMGGAAYIYQVVDATPETTMYCGVWFKLGSLAELWTAVYDETNGEFIVPTKTVIASDIVAERNGYSLYEILVVVPATCQSLRFYPARSHTNVTGDVDLFSAYVSTKSRGGVYTDTSANEFLPKPDTLHRLNHDVENIEDHEPEVSTAFSAIRADDPYRGFWEDQRGYAQPPYQVSHGGGENLLDNSNAFSSGWQTAGVTIDSEDNSDPFGGSNATAVSMSDGKMVQKAFSSEVGVPYTVSGYIKKYNHSEVYVGVSRVGFVLLDLDAGVKIGHNVEPLEFSMQDVGSGWYRWHVFFVGDGGVVGVRPAASSTEVDDTSAYIYGAQLERGNQATAYKETGATAIPYSPPKIWNLQQPLNDVSSVEPGTDDSYWKTSASEEDLGTASAEDVVTGTGDNTSSSLTTVGWVTENAAVGDDFNESGNYPNLRARSTTKADVGLGSVTNHQQVQNGTGAGQLNNTVKIGWSNGSELLLEVDSTDFGADWPLSLSASRVATGTFPYARLPMTSTQVFNWDTAYSWGDHANAGYLTSVSWSDITDGSSTDIITSGDIVAGWGSGSIGLTANDGHGNANLTFNHRDGDPDVDGNAGRITVNVDTNTNPMMSFAVGGDVAQGTDTNLAKILDLKTNSVISYVPLYVNSNEVYHEGHKPTPADIGAATNSHTHSYDDLTDKPTAADIGASAVGHSHSYAELTSKPTLGSAASQDVSAFATAAQGSTADSALQPGDVGSAASLDVVSGTGDTTNGNLTDVAWVLANAGGMDATKLTGSTDLLNIQVPDVMNFFYWVPDGPDRVPVNAPSSVAWGILYVGYGGESTWTVYTSKGTIFTRRYTSLNGWDEKWTKTGGEGNGLQVAPHVQLSDLDQDGNGDITLDLDLSKYNFFTFDGWGFLHGGPGGYVDTPGEYIINLNSLPNTTDGMLYGHIAFRGLGRKSAFSINATGKTIHWLNSDYAPGGGSGDLDVIHFYTTPMEPNKILMSLVDARNGGY